MEDLRDAKETVAKFAALIDRLRPDFAPPPPEGVADATSHTSKRQTARRQDSTGSQKSTRSTVSARWMPSSTSLSKKKRTSDWAETTEGILWHELEKPQREVAMQFQVDQTALKEFISSREMMELGNEFARHYGDYVREKPYWAAEDLFFELQAVKQGDAQQAKWTKSKAYKKEWDLADHLVRFVLLAEKARLYSDQEKWRLWEWTFAIKVGFFLSILRCYNVRHAKQRQLTREAEASAGRISQANNRQPPQLGPATPLTPRVTPSPGAKSVSFVIDRPQARSE
ncbi:Uu.00g140750.m01.CDS01 [Anthostomella pinea]|uniref:Uu.00g140750.m01.CDS01 n=1 Tax=Anthostomella pinea TaxID=933095 RepID=A0AAI8YLF8_9PEZI|nr:Uu.00g140750.m01.CDS01 [Anthostomella pinea]